MVTDRIRNKDWGNTVGEGFGDQGAPNVQMTDLDIGLDQPGREEREANELAETGSLNLFYWTSFRSPLL